MDADRATAEDSNAPERARPEEPEDPSGNLWKLLEGGLRVAALYFAYKHNEAATLAVAGWHTGGMRFSV